MNHLIDFDAIPWHEPAKGVRSKAIVKRNQQIRLVAFLYGFIESDWCLKGHAGHNGQFAIDYSRTIERYKAGNVIYIPKGGHDKYKAILNEGKKVTLLLFEVLSI